MSMAEAKPALPNSTLRSYAMMGIVFWAFGFVLNRIGNLLAQFWLIPYADTLSGLGFVVALYTATLAGIGTRLTVLIGLIFGIGIFYAGEPDTTHLASGVSFGLSQSTNVLIGQGLVAFTTVFLVALAFYLTRAKHGHPTPRIDPGSSN